MQGVYVFEEEEDCGLSYTYSISAKIKCHKIVCLNYQCENFLIYGIVYKLAGTYKIMSKDKHTRMSIEFNSVCHCVHIVHV